jgi:hypothetical protein
MNAEQIEALMTRMNLPWSRVVKNMWNIDDRGDNLPGVTVSIEKGEKHGRDLVKFVTFICDVPHDAGPEFFLDFLRLNFRVDHGAFAMESKSEMFYLDTLELAGLDPNEFEAALTAMRNAPRMFQEKYDIDIYTMGRPQF